MLGIIEMEEFMVNHYLISSESLGHYWARKRPPTRRMIKCILMLLFMMAHNFKYAILMNDQDDWLLVMLGEFLYKLYDMKMLAVTLLSGGIQVRPFLKILIYHAKIIS